MDQKGKMHATRIVLLKPAKYEGPPQPTSNTNNSSFNNKTHQQRGNKRSFLSNITLYMSPSTWGQKTGAPILYV